MYDPAFIPHLPRKYFLNATVITVHPDVPPGKEDEYKYVMRNFRHRTFYAIDLGPPLRQVTMHMGASFHSYSYDVCIGRMKRRFLYSVPLNSPMLPTCTEDFSGNACNPTYDAQWLHVNTSRHTSLSCHTDQGFGVYYAWGDYKHNGSVCIRYARQPDGYVPRVGDWSSAVLQIAKQEVADAEARKAARAANGIISDAEDRRDDDITFPRFGQPGKRGVAGAQGRANAGYVVTEPRVWPRLLRWDSHSTMSRVQWNFEAFDVEVNDSMFAMPDMCQRLWDGPDEL